MSLDLKVPPDIAWVAVAGLMWFTSRTSAGFGAAAWVRGSAAAVIVLSGVILIIGAWVALDRAGTTWHPSEPGRAQVLVTSGVYRFSRNPTYVGMQLVLLGLAPALDNALSVLVAALFGVYIDRFQIRPEESALSVSFGDEYCDYARRVRRWI